MRKKLKELVDYFTVRNVNIDMHDTSFENIAKGRRLNIVFGVRPLIAIMIMLATWTIYVLVPSLKLAPLPDGLFIKGLASLGLVFFISLVLVWIEEQRRKTHFFD